MQSWMLLMQFASQNIALFCCALFAGASVYVSLVEHPTMIEGGRQLTGTYMLLAHPRPAFLQTSLAVTGSLAGILAGASGNAAWWLAGGLLLCVATLVHLFFAIPEARRLVANAVSEDPKMRGSVSLKRLAKLHAIQSLCGLAALFMFITKA